jgi:hypothetical protein
MSAPCGWAQSSALPGSAPPPAISGSQSITNGNSLAVTGGTATGSSAAPANPVAIAPTGISAGQATPTVIAGAMVASPPPPMLLGTPAVPGSAGVKPVPNAIPQGTMDYVKAEVHSFIFHSPAEQALYDHAASLFPSFCKDWQRMLHDRETNNLEHIDWKPAGGYETATYTGYGTIESCVTKESLEGIPIGKLTYEEMNYYLVGKTVNEAQHAAPKLIHQTHTLEIFSWDKNKWFY